MFTVGPSKASHKTAIVASYPYKWLILKDLISPKDNGTDA